jgi:preprotein translocase subunit SecY
MADIKMFKNNEEKTMGKLIRVTLLALLCSLLSAFYLSMVQDADKVADEISQPG